MMFPLAHGIVAASGAEPAPAVLCPYNVSSPDATHPEVSITVSEPGVVNFGLDQPDPGGSTINTVAFTSLDLDSYVDALSGLTEQTQVSIPTGGSNIVVVEASYDVSSLSSSSGSNDSTIELTIAGAKVFDSVEGYHETSRASFVIDRSGTASVTVQKSKLSESGFQSGFNYEVVDAAVPKIGGVGFYFNQSTGQIGVVHSSLGDLGYIGVIDTGDFIGESWLHSSIESVGVSLQIILRPAESPFSGGTGSASVIAKNTEITLSYPSGAVDPCINTI